MLVLKRKNGEGLRLTLPDGQRVEIFVDQIGGGSVKTHTVAPLSVKVSRIDKQGNLQVRKNERHIQTD